MPYVSIDTMGIFFFFGKFLFQPLKTTMHMYVYVQSFGFYWQLTEINHINSKTIASNKV